MKMPTLAVSWRYALLNYAQFRAVEQVPSLACRTPLIPLAGCDVYDSKHDALRMCLLTRCNPINVRLPPDRIGAYAGARGLEAPLCLDRVSYIPDIPEKQTGHAKSA